MPHYRDGTEAKVGDLVKGRGYNVKHEIVGKVVNVRPGPDAQNGCTLSVAHVGAYTKVFFSDGSDKPFSDCLVVANVEFGDTVSFDKIS
jgi:hypothetical protein